MIDEKHAVTLSNRAECFRLIGDYARAANDATEASQVYPKYFKSYLRLGRICEDLNDWLRAGHYYQIAFTMSNENKQIKMSLEKVNRRLREME